MTEIYTSFGDKVRELRNKLNITQEELSNKSGLYRTYIAGIEAGKRNISLKNLEKISKALEVDPNELLK